MNDGGYLRTCSMASLRQSMCDPRVHLSYVTNVRDLELDELYESM